MRQSPIIVAAIVAVTSVAAAEPERGWRAGSDAFGNNDSRRVVHYVSGGLLPGDKVTLTLGTSGHFPLQVYDRLAGWQGRARLAGWPSDGEVPGGEASFPDELSMTLMSCHGFADPLLYGPLVEACYSRHLLADAFLNFSALIDVSHLAYSDDPVIGIRGVGLKLGATGDFIPFAETERGSLCATDEDSWICVSCFRNFEALAAGDPGMECLASDEDITLMAVDANFPWLSFVETVRDAGDQLVENEVAVQLIRRSGSGYSISFASANLMEAIFAPRE